MFSKLHNIIINLHNDEAGEMPVGPILVITFIVIPVVILLVFFKDKLVSTWEDVVSKLFEEGEDSATNPKNNFE